MPILPYPISGTILDVNSVAIENAIVEVYNLRNAEFISTKTDSSGGYIVDLANLTSDYVDNDLILVRAYKGGKLFKFKESEQTVDTGVGSLTVNLTLIPEFPTQPKDNDDKVLQRKEHHTTANAKKVVQVTPDGKDVDTNNPVAVQLSDGTDEISSSNPLTVENYSFIDPNNTTTANIASGESFTGEWANTLNLQQFMVTLKSSGQGDLYVERSANGVSVGKSTLYTNVLDLNIGQRFGDSPSSEYLRLRFVNQSGAEITAFRLSMRLSTIPTGFSFQQLKQPQTDDTMSLNTSATIAGLKPDDTRGYVNITQGNNLKISSEEFETEFYYDEPLPIAQVLSIPISDELDFTYVSGGNGDGEIETIIFTRESTPHTTLTLTYDSEDRVSNITKS